MTKKHYGNQFPTQSLLLPYENTYGDDAIEIYERSGRKAYEWQKNLIQPMLAVNSDNLWTWK
ncbi:hypothetical protein [Allofustis seminis]|uniref:hypothetical protein n=1 Tax=Allofustis seminis TaxID=166939 RepID=UPI00036B60B2|nr:hypothetical protein [Allofustis seminis]